MNVIFIVMLFAAFVVSICIHESAHALMALALGDPGPRNDGRVSLNPLRQMAAMGTAVAIVLSFLSGVTLGWGKPVRFDALKLKPGPNFGMVLVALAGPLANLALGVGGAFALQAIPQSPQFYLDVSLGLQGATPLQRVGGALPWWSLRGEQLLFAFIVVNIGLFLINIIPLYPLDGYRVVFALLPSRQAVSFRRAEPYMELIILAILFLVPMLLQFAGAPHELSPVYWIYKGIDAIIFAIVNPAYGIFPLV